MALKPDEQPTLIRGTVTESASNTFTAKEISIPRDLNSRLLFDADRITMTVVRPLRTTEGLATIEAQLQLSDDEPTAMMAEDNPDLIAQLLIDAQYSTVNALVVLSAIFVRPNQDGYVDSTRWRNFLYDDKIWLCIEGAGNSSTRTATCKILGKLDKASNEDFQALVLSKV